MISHDSHSDTAAESATMGGVELGEEEREGGGRLLLHSTASSASLQHCLEGG